MIGKVSRGQRVQGLIRYLYGPGRFNQHDDPHIVAGFDDPAALEPAIRLDGSRDFHHLDGLMRQPLALLGDRNYPRPVWHLSVRAHPDDPVLTDQQWAQIAAEIMHRTGLAPGGDDDAVRWIAVRHAADHIHIVATLARQDGIRPQVWNDAYRIRAACRTVEERFGLRRTAPADRTAARRPKRGENEKARRAGRADPARTVLRRCVTTAAATARTEEEFFDLLKADGLLIRTRHGNRVSGQRSGYAVALPDDCNRSGEPVFYSGGKLAADLSLPKLRYRWRADGPADPLSTDYRPVSGRHLSARSARAVLRTAVRQAADRSRTADEFFEHLHRAGVIARQRFSRYRLGQVTGYAVTLPGHVGHNHQPHWYAAGQLAADLTWPHLQRRWTTRAGPPAKPAPVTLSHQERQALYRDAARAATYATAQLRRHVAIDPHRARDACWAASDTLHVAAKATGNSHLRRAADAYDRAARAPYGRIPSPTGAGDALRTAARLLALAGLAGGTETLGVIVLVTNLVTLIDTIAQLHQVRQNQAQAAAARSAAGHLRGFNDSDRSAWWSGIHERVPTPVAIAMSDFPRPWAAMTPTRTADTQVLPTDRGREQSRPRRPSP